VFLVGHNDPLHEKACISFGKQGAYTITAGLGVARRPSPNQPEPSDTDTVATMNQQFLYNLIKQSLEKSRQSFMMNFIKQANGFVCTLNLNDSKQESFVVDFLNEMKMFFPETTFPPTTFVMLCTDDVVGQFFENKINEQILPKSTKSLRFLSMNEKDFVEKITEVVQELVDRAADPDHVAANLHQRRSNSFHLNTA